MNTLMVLIGWFDEGGGEHGESESEEKGGTENRAGHPPPPLSFVSRRRHTSLNPAGPRAPVPGVA